MVFMRASVHLSVCVLRTSVCVWVCVSGGGRAGRRVNGGLTVIGHMYPPLVSPLVTGVHFTSSRSFMRSFLSVAGHVVSVLGFSALRSAVA